MDDKEKVRRLYYRITNIHSKVTVLNNDITALEQVLKESFTINNKMLGNVEIQSNKNRISSVNQSIINVKNNLRSNL